MIDENKNLMQPPRPTLEELIISEYRRPQPASLTFSRVLLFFRNHFLKIAIITLVGTFLITGLSYLLPNTYLSSVLLVYSPPSKNFSILQETQMPIEYYSSLAASLPLLQDTIVRARDRNVLSPQQSISDDNFSTRIMTREMPQQNDKLPLLMLEVTATTPETARDLANIWAEVLLGTVKSQNALQLKSTLGLLLSQGRENQLKILEVQNSLLKIEDFHRRQADEITLHMDDKIRSFQVRYPLDLWQDQIEQKKKQLLQLQDKTFEADQNIQRMTNQVRLLREQLQAQPPIYTLSQSFITDEALWENLGRPDSPLDISALKDLQLKSEHLNKIHEELLDQLIEFQVTLNTLIPFRDYCQEQVTRLQTEIQQQGELLTSKQLEMQKLEIEKHTELLQNESEKNRKLKELNLLQQSYQAYFDETARGFGEAENLQNSSFIELAIASPASIPFEPIRPKRLYFALFAFMASLLMALLIAGYLQASSQFD